MSAATGYRFVRASEDKPHRCPECWAIRVGDDPRARWWKVYSCPKCLVRWWRGWHD